MTQHLHDRLRQAADDTGRPMTTDLDDLLDRARARRGRHRMRITGTVVLTAAALVGTTLGVRAALPDDARPAAERQPVTEQSDEPADPALSDREVIRRCLPQLAKYDAYPQYAGTASHPAAQWRLPRERAYAPGDVVALQDREGNLNPVLCIVPQGGHEHDPVPFSDLEPSASDHRHIAETCSELLLPQPNYDFRTGRTDGFRDEHQPDLRNARVLAVDSAGPVVEAMLAKGDQRFACALSPVRWDAGPAGVTTAANDGYEVWLEGSAIGASAKSIVDEDAAFYYGAGTMPRDAASIEFTLDSGATFRVTVDDGSYAVVHKEPGTRGLERYDYRVLDARGKVLHQGDDRM